MYILGQLCILLLHVFTGIAQLQCNAVTRLETDATVAVNISLPNNCFECINDHGVVSTNPQWAMFWASNLSVILPDGRLLVPDFSLILAGHGVNHVARFSCMESQQFSRDVTIISNCKYRFCI